MKKIENSLVCFGGLTSRLEQPKAVHGGNSITANERLKTKDWREEKLSDHSMTKFSQLKQDAILPLNSPHLVYILLSWLKQPQQGLMSCCQVWTSGESIQRRCETHLMSRVESLFLSGVKWCVWPSCRSPVSVTGCTFTAQLSPAVGGRCSTHQPALQLKVAAVHRNARPTTETDCCPPSGDLRGYAERISSLWLQKYSESQQYRGCPGAVISSLG